MRASTPFHWNVLKIAALCALLLFGVQNVQAQKGKDKISKISNQQKALNVQTYLSNIKRIHRWILKKLREARKAKGLPAAECLGEKLTATRALRFLAERSNLTLQEAIAKSEKEKVNYHYRQISQTEARVRDLEAEAKLCRSEEAFNTGPTKVTVITPPVLADDPTLPPWKEPIVFRPMNASSFY